MKRYLITAAILAAVTPALGQSTSPGLIAGSSNSVTIASNVTNCSITYSKGNIHTEGCDFSLPLVRLRFTAGDRTWFKIEADQPNPITTSSTISVPAR